MQRFIRQRGVTLLECLIALAISSVILAGLTYTLNIALMSYHEAQENYGLRDQAHAVMRRIEAAAESALHKKTQDLSVKDETTSSDWFYGMHPDGKQRKITYTWSAANQVLNEIDDSGIAKAVLHNVASFSVTAPTAIDATLVTISLTVGSKDKPLVLRETLRLGGAW